MRPSGGCSIWMCCGRTAARWSGRSWGCPGGSACSAGRAPRSAPGAGSTAWQNSRRRPGKSCKRLWTNGTAGRRRGWPARPCCMRWRLPPSRAWWTGRTAEATEIWISLPSRPAPQPCSLILPSASASGGRVAHRRRHFGRCGCPKAGGGGNAPGNRGSQHP